MEIWLRAKNVWNTSFCTKFTTGNVYDVHLKKQREFTKHIIYARRDFKSFRIMFLEEVITSLCMYLSQPSRLLRLGSPKKKIPQTTLPDCCKMRQGGLVVDSDPYQTELDPKQWRATLSTYHQYRFSPIYNNFNLQLGYEHCYTRSSNSSMACRIP